MVQKKNLTMRGKFVASPPSRPVILRDPKTARFLKKLFGRRREILLAFLFGSFATKRMRPASDVDMGILFKSVPDMEAINGLSAELASILQKEVDLVVLNYASPVLKMQILKNGILVYASDKKYFHLFFVDTINQYDDLKQIRKNCEENILKGRIYAVG